MIPFMLNDTNSIAGIFRKLNYYFIADEDEEIALSDYLFFYGITSLIAIIGMAFLILNFIG